ncbi:hypothetical protein BO71DRAFT_327935 [Aspergillus ellipticus CBS 707.79]|uniref:Zn(2)-C6 fungal-type domain-containing protein n=1 Tax=Aspergillus ellipticus CBS 707.79 TaxID=1448320 RepID=A0A319D7B1_9EURO|nr:hypothetical protein BO71DRAFT_327935 [Aspergillus ellipticus CBS 707.79]
MADGNRPVPEGSSTSSTPAAPPKRNPPSVAGKSRGRSRYASKACAECRRRRAKCDGSKPSCSRCLGRQLQCVYTTDDDGRGTAPKSYVRLLQARISVLERILQLHSIDIDASAAQLLEQDAALESTTEMNTGSLCTEVSQLCAAFEGTLALDEDLNFDQDGEARYFGTTSGRLAFQTSKETQKFSLPGHRPQVLNLYTQALQDETQISEELETHLLGLYFTWEQPWCQVVDERLFRESKQDNGRYFSPLLLNCILAAASRYSDRLDIRSDPDDPNTAGRFFLETAEALLYIDIKQPTITTLQSLAILGTVYVAFGCDAAGWLHKGMANRLVLDMGLHLEPNALTGPNPMSPEEAELRRQIYWALYCDDKLAAIYTGRSCTMLVRNIQPCCARDFQGVVCMPSKPNPIDHCERCTSRSVSRTSLVGLQIALGTLSQILERILLNLYAPKRLTNDAHKRNFFDCCLLALRNWYYCLSSDLKPVRAGKASTFPQTYILCMVYHTAVILLAKPYLEHSDSPAAPSRPQQLQQEAPDDLIQQTSTLYLEAANNICSLGEQYRQVFGGFRKSPITATHCTLSAALALLNPQCRGPQNADFNDVDMDKMTSCLNTLQELSQSWTPPRKYHRSILRVIHSQQSSGLESDLDVFSAFPNVGFPPSYQASDNNPLGISREAEWDQTGNEFDWSMWTNMAVENDLPNSGGQKISFMDVSPGMSNDSRTTPSLSWDHRL